MLTLSLESSATLLSTKYRDLVISYTDPTTEQSFPPLYFNIRTYDKISGTSALSNGPAILAPLIRFVEGLSDRNQRILYRYYEAAHAAFAELDVKENIVPQDHTDLIANLFTLTNEMVDKTNLCRKLAAFVRTPDFVYPDDSEAGKSYYHSTAMTFDQNEIYDMTALSMLFKLLIPIWGEYIAHFDIFSINPIYREQKAIEIVDEILDTSIFARTYQKFVTYVETIVKRECTMFDKDQNRSVHTDHIFSFHNITEAVFTEVIEATILLKKTVLYECGTIKPEGNVSSIMVYIHNGVQNTVGTQLITLSKTVSILPLNDQDQREGEENNQSAMEYYAKPSDMPADYPVFIEVMMEREIPKLARDYKVPMADVIELGDFYLRSPFEVGPMAYSCVASLVGNRVCGSASLDYPQFREFSRLVAITQHFMARQGMFSLLPFLSSGNSTALMDTELDNNLGAIARIKEDLKVNFEYERLLENYSGFTEKTVVVEKKKKGKKNKTDVVRIDVERQITRLITWCTSQPHTVNLPGSFWDKYPKAKPIVIGSPAPITDSLLSELCRFYRFFHDKRNPIEWT